MLTLAPITAGNLQAFKTIRLRALLESPHAFGSTYAREAGFDEAEWLRRALRWNGDRGIGYLAMEGSAPCGIAGGSLDENNPAHAELLAMWSAPTHRNRGVGRLLVESVAAWARLRGAHALRLMVTSTNDGAIQFYTRLGFRMTGRTEPYPNNPDIFEFEMSKSI